MQLSLLPLPLLLALMLTLLFTRMRPIPLWLRTLDLELNMLWYMQLALYLAFELPRRINGKGNNNGKRNALWTGSVLDSSLRVAAVSGIFWRVVGDGVPIDTRIE